MARRKTDNGGRRAFDELRESTENAVPQRPHKLSQAQIDWDMQYGHPNFKTGVRFILDNEAVFDALVAACFELKGQGITKAGISYAWGKVRYDRAIDIERDGGPRLNNNYQHAAAQVIRHCEPRLRDWLDVREH